MEKPIYDLILGNIPGIRDTPDENWGKVKELEVQADLSQAHGVKTRAQIEKQKRPTTPLIVPDNQREIIDKKTLVKAQKKMIPLNVTGRWRQMVKKAMPGDISHSICK